MVALPQDFRRCDLQAWRRERQEKSSREGAFCSSSCLPSSRHSGLWLPVPLSGVNVSWLRVWWLSFYGFVVGFLFRCQESVVHFVTFVLHFLSLSLCLLDVVLDFSHFNTPHALRLSSFLATVVESVCIFDLSWFSGGFVICLHLLLDSFTLVVMVSSFLFFAPQSSVDCFLHPFIPVFFRLGSSYQVFWAVCIINLWFGGGSGGFDGFLPFFCACNLHHSVSSFAVLCLITVS